MEEEYRGKLTYFDNETGKEDSEKDLSIEIFFPRENEGPRH
jgi:hypothetical protein